MYEREEEKVCVTFVPLLISFIVEKTGRKEPTFHLQSAVILVKALIRYLHVSLRHTHMWQMYLLPFNSHARAVNPYTV